MSQFPALATFQKREPAGAPFTPTSADNGLSVDPSGKIVLGGPVLTPSMLLDNRYIDVDGSFIQLVDSSLLPAAPFVQLSAADVLVFDGTGFEGGISVNGIFAQKSGSGSSSMNPGVINVGDATGNERMEIDPREIIFFDNAVVPNRLHLLGVGTELQFTPDSFVPAFTFDFATGNFVAAGTIQTDDPGMGAGDWLLGDIVFGMSTLDVTKYVQVNIGGTNVKLATFS